MSRDTYYYQVAAEADIDDWAKFMKPFGFGQKTGIDIDGELPGILPTREWKAKRFPKRSEAARRRSGFTRASGRGFNIFTPLQMAYATAILANRGWRSGRIW